MYIQFTSWSRRVSYYLLTLTTRFNVRCSPCPRVALHHCHVHFDSWNGSPYTMPFYFEPTMHRVITRNDCLVHLPRPCVWVHTLNMTIPTKTPTSQSIFYRTLTQSASQFLRWYLVS